MPPLKFKILNNPLLAIRDITHAILRIMPYRDIAGKVYGRLTAIAHVEQKVGGAHWKCRCICGAETVVAISHLTTGHTQSCGCLLEETRKQTPITHGMTRTVEYSAWAAMIKRCYNPSRFDSVRYKNIKVFPAWRTSFAEFYAYVGPKPSPDYSLDRINNDGDYAPGNVKWSTQREQAQNTSKTKFWELDGVKKSRAQWARELGFPHSTQILRRLQSGWSLRDALTIPSKAWKNRHA